MGKLPSQGKTSRLMVFCPKNGSCALLVKRDPLEVSPHFPVHRRARKTAPSLGESFSIPLVEVPMLSTSPNMPKSPKNDTGILVGKVIQRQACRLSPSHAPATLKTISGHTCEAVRRPGLSAGATQCFSLPRLLDKVLTLPAPRLYRSHSRRVSNSVPPLRVLAAHWIAENGDGPINVHRGSARLYRPGMVRLPS
jgi:hypothetical protein